MNKSGRKFIALLLSLFIVLIIFILLSTGLLIEPRGKSFFSELCEFILYAYVAYVSGNGLEHIARKFNIETGKQSKSRGASEIEP